MPIQTQRISFPFVQGVDTKTDPRQMAPGKLEELENADFSSTGAIKKRKKMEKLEGLVAPWIEYDNATAKSGTVHDSDRIKRIERIASANGNLIIEGEAEDRETAGKGHGTRSFIYSDNASRWCDCGPGMGMRIEAVSRKTPTSDDIVKQQCAFNERYSVYLWGEDDSSFTYYYCEVLDRETGVQVMAPTQIADAVDQEPRMVIYRDIVYIVYQTGSGATATYDYVTVNLRDMSGPSVSAGVNLVADGERASNSGGGFDILVADGAIWLAYAQRTTSDLVVNRWTDDLSGSEPTVASTATTATTVTRVRMVPVRSKSGVFRMGMLVENGGTLYTQMIGADGAAATSIGGIRALSDMDEIVGAREPDADDLDSDNGAWRIFIERSPASVGLRVISTVLKFDGTAAVTVGTGNSTLFTQTKIASRAFTYQGRAYCWLQFTTTNAGGAGEAMVSYHLATTVDRTANSGGTIIMANPHCAGTALFARGVYSYSAGFGDSWYHAANVGEVDGKFYTVLPRRDRLSDVNFGGGSPSI